MSKYRFSFITNFCRKDHIKELEESFSSLDKEIGSLLLIEKQSVKEIGSREDQYAWSKYNEKRWTENENERIDRWGLIEFHEKYFKQTEINKSLTILHEIIHLYLMSGFLNKWWAETDQISKKIEHEAIVKEPENNFFNLSWILIKIIQIVDEYYAEKIMKDNFHDFWQGRVKKLVEMLEVRPDCYEEKMKSFAKYGYFFEMLKCCWHLKLIEDTGFRDKIIKKCEHFKQKCIDNGGEELVKLDSKLMEFSNVNVNLPLESPLVIFATETWQKENV